MHAMTLDPIGQHEGVDEHAVASTTESVAAILKVATMPPYRAAGRQSQCRSQWMPSSLTPDLLVRWSLIADHLVVSIDMDDDFLAQL